MSQTPFNELSDAQAERLAILAEECGEVIQVVGKILRHGYNSTHPDDPDGPDNRDLLEKELGHVMSIQKMMSEDDLYIFKIRKSCRKKLKAIDSYLHHQRANL